MLTHVLKVLAIAKEILKALNVFHFEILAVSSATAHVHAVGLVKLSDTFVVAERKRILNRFHRQIKPPILTVHGDVNKAAKGGGNTELVHHCVDEKVLHIGVVLNDIVEHQLVKPVVGGVFVVVVELNLEAVTLTLHRPDTRKRGVALGTYRHVSVRLTVNDHGTGRIFLVLAGLDKAVPIVHNDVKGVNTGVVENT